MLGLKMRKQSLDKRTGSVERRGAPVVRPVEESSHPRRTSGNGEAVHRRAGACRGCFVDPIVGTRYRALRSGYGSGIISFCGACMDGPLGPSFRTHGPFKVLHDPLPPEEVRRELREDEDGGDLFHRLLCGDEAVLFRILSHLAGRDLASLECTCHLFRAKAKAVRHGRNIVEHAAQTAVEQRVAPCVPRPPRSWTRLFDSMSGHPTLILRYVKRTVPRTESIIRPELELEPEPEPEPEPEQEQEQEQEAQLLANVGAAARLGLGAGLAAGRHRAARAGVERLTAARLQLELISKEGRNALLADSRCLQPLGPTAASTTARDILQAAKARIPRPMAIEFSPVARFCDEQWHESERKEVKSEPERYLHRRGVWSAAVRPCAVDNKINLIISENHSPHRSLSLEIWPLSDAEVRAATGDDDCCDEACGTSWLLHVIPQPQPQAKPRQDDVEVLRCPSATHDGTREQLRPHMATIMHSGDVLSVPWSMEERSMEKPRSHAPEIAPSSVATRPGRLGFHRAHVLRKMQVHLRQERLQRAREAPVSVDTSAMVALPVNGILFDSRWIGLNCDHWEDGLPTEQQARAATAGETLTWWDVGP
jgi:hypothetical protein